jgi:hypothetical protein
MTFMNDSNTGRHARTENSAIASMSPARKARMITW